MFFRDLVARRGALAESSLLVFEYVCAQTFPEYQFLLIARRPNRMEKLLSNYVYTRILVLSDISFWSSPCQKSHEKYRCSEDARASRCCAGKKLEKVPRHNARSERKEFHELFTVLHLAGHRFYSSESCVHCEWISCLCLCVCSDRKYKTL